MEGVVQPRQAKMTMDDEEVTPISSGNHRIVCDRDGSDCKIGARPGLLGSGILHEEVA